MGSLAINMMVVLQIVMAIGLGVLIMRNGRNGSNYQLASETTRPFTIGNSNLPKAKELYENVPVDAKLLQLDKQALDEAYHNQLLLLWTTWLKQQAGDPTYFQNGLVIARRAYKTASEQIEKRENRTGPN